VLDLAAEQYGKNSTVYGTAKSYVIEQGDAPALSSLTHAQGMISLSHAWLTKYKPAIHRYCPQWNSTHMRVALTGLSDNLKSAEAIFEPAQWHTRYETAEADICSSFLPAVGVLSLMQIPIAYFLLPALAVATSIFLKSASSGADRSYSRLSQQEGEGTSEDKGKSNTFEFGGIKFDEDTLLSYGYYGVFALSVFTFVVGAFLYFLPSMSIVRRITATLLYASGGFLLMNSDLIVTYLRMHGQLERTKASNKEFESNLKAQTGKIKELKKAERGLEEIKGRYGDDVNRAKREADRLSITIESDLRTLLKDVMDLYSDKDTPGFIDAGQEFQDMLGILRSIFGDVFKDFDLREHKLTNVLESHTKFKKDKGIDERILADLFSMALMKSDVDRISGSAEKILNKAAQRSSSSRPKPS